LKVLFIVNTGFQLKTRQFIEEVYVERYVFFVVKCHWQQQIRNRLKGNQLRLIYQSFWSLRDILRLNIILILWQSSYRLNQRNHNAENFLFTFLINNIIFIGLIRKKKNLRYLNEFLRGEIP